MQALNPEKGIDAIATAARAISNMKLGRIDNETTANVGIIRGGHSTNIVCDLWNWKQKPEALIQKLIIRLTI